MAAGDSRSEQVVTAYKRHKLTVSALHHIRRMLEGFERERATDRRLALLGIGAILFLLAAAAAWIWFGGTQVVIS